MNPWGAIVLCGGQSRRMGRPKAWLPVGEELMLPRVVRLLSEVTPNLVVVAAAEQSLPELPSSVCVTRDSAADRGPLQGLADGLHALPDQAEAVYVSSCDVPYLQAAFVEKMFALLGDHAICVPRAQGFLHPLAAVYRRSVLPTVQQLLKEDRLRPMYLFETLPTRVVEEADLMEIDPELRSLRNVNTPEEYQQALREYL